MKALFQKIYKKVKKMLHVKEQEIYKINGHNNKIILVTNGKECIYYNLKKIPGLNINITGNNNIIKLVAESNFVNSNIAINSSNNYVEIGLQSSLIFDLSIWNGNNQKFVWESGKGSFRHSRFYLCQEGSSIEIKKDCLLSDVTIWASDAHRVIDFNTKQCINNVPAHIVVGEHSWCATETMILKGAKVASNSILAARSVVTKEFKKEYTLLAGNPATVKKENITWE